MSKKLTVLLDAGGIIVDETEIEKYYGRLVSSLISGINGKYSPNDYQRDLDTAVDSYCSNVYDFILWKNVEPNLELFNVLKKKCEEDIVKNRPPLMLSNGINEEVCELAGNLKVGIAGQYGKELLEILKRHELLDFIDFPLIREDFDTTKPDPRFYEATLQRIGVAPEDAIMVGDRIDKDIAPAKYLGMKTVRVLTGIHINQRSRTPEEIPDLELRQIRGMARAIINKFAHSS